MAGSLSHFTDFTLKGQRTDRPNWPRPSGGLRSASNHLGPRKPFVLRIIHTGWHGPMDEPGAYRSRKVRVQEQPSNETLGLLRPRNGYIRDYQWESPLPQRHEPGC